MRVKLRDQDMLDRYMTARGCNNQWMADQVGSKVDKGCTREFIRKLRNGTLKGCEQDYARAIEEVLQLLPETLFALPVSHSMSRKVTSQDGAAA